MINFLNTIPLEMAPGAASVPFESVPGSPAKINQLLLKGEVDIGVISSAFFLAHDDRLARFGNLGIVSDGPAMSVGLFSDFDLREEARRGRREVAVFETPKSATSVLLNRVVLKRFHGLEVRAVAREEDAEAVLLIGDECLATRAVGRWRHFLDLGETWKEGTGLPTVFAVLAVNRESLATRNQELTLYFSELLDHHRRLYLDRDALVAIARTRSDLPEDVLYEYFRSLSYIIGRREERSLELFARFIDEYRRLSPDHEAAVERVLRERA